MGNFIFFAVLWILHNQVKLLLLLPSALPHSRYVYSLFIFVGTFENNINPSHPIPNKEKKLT